MTMRLPEDRVRALYERWRRGEVSLRGAARELGVEVRTVMLRWERWDAGIAAKVRYRRAAHAASERRYRHSLKADPDILPRRCGQISAMDAGEGVLYKDRASRRSAENTHARSDHHRPNGGRDG